MNEYTLNNAPKGQDANSPGHRPGYRDMVRIALKGQKPYHVFHAFALTGRKLRTTFTQGVALGWELTGLSGRIYKLAKLEIITTLVNLLATSMRKK